MNRHSLAIRTWKFALLALALVFNGACGSDSGGDDDMEIGNTPDGGGAGKGGAGKGDVTGSGGSGGSGDTSTCDDDSTVLLPTSTGRVLGALALDDDAIYFSQGSSESDMNGIFRLPKKGGEATRIGEMDNLVDGGPIYLDGDDLYYGDSKLNRIKKDGSGSVEMLADAEGGVSEITGDKDAIYFVHGNFCCDSLGTDTTQYLMRLDKKSGEVTELVGAADMESIASDGENVFWLGSIEKREEIGALSESAQSVMRTPVAGGDSTVVFETPEDLSGLNASSGFGGGLVLTDSDVVFGSINLHESTVGIHKIAKTANKGTPTELTKWLSLNSGFVLGASVYTSNGDAIDRIALAGGDYERVACGGDKTPTYLMAHDADNLYYARFTGAGGDSDKIGEELRVIALPK